MKDKDIQLRREWINLGKLSSIESIFVYANTEDMIWRIGVMYKNEE
jgi:hypothetical protein